MLPDNLILLILAILILLYTIYPFSPLKLREKDIPVPSRYHNQKRAYIHHQFPKQSELFSSDSSRVYSTNNVLHVKGFRNKDFDGNIKLLTKQKDSEKLLEIPPWVLRDNSHPIQHLFISCEDPILKSIAKKYNLQITQPKFVGSMNDPWLRDEFQVGYMDKYTYIMNGPKNGALDAWIETFCDKNIDVHHFHLENSCSGSSYDFFGNLVCLDKKRLIYGTNSDKNGMCPTILDFIRHQKHQELIPINTSWLAVGHADEIVSMMPGNKLAMISPGLAIKHLSALPPDHLVIIAEQVSTAGELLQKYGAYNLQIEENMLAETKKLLNPDILMPVLFKLTDDGRAQALTYNLVNVIVDPRFLIVPKDNGPVIDGKPLWGLNMWKHYFPSLDIFQVEMSEYHHLLGGLHCASNEIRN